MIGEDEGGEASEQIVAVYKDKLILEMNRTLEYDETLALLGRLDATQKSAENYTRGYFWCNGTIYGIKTEMGKSEIEISKPLIKNSDKKDHGKNYKDLKVVSKNIKNILKQISEEQKLQGKNYEKLIFSGGYLKTDQTVFDSLERELLDGQLALLGKRLSDLYMNDKIIIIAEEDNSSKLPLSEEDKPQKTLDSLQTIPKLT